MERIAIDVMAPYPPLIAISNTSSSSLITSRNESYAMSNQEAETVANVVIREFISRFVVPRQLHTDQGWNFESRLLQEICRILEIDKDHAFTTTVQQHGGAIQQDPRGPAF